MKQQHNNTIYLTYLFCYFFDIRTFRSDCIPGAHVSENWSIECSVNATFHTGGTVKDLSSTGHKVSFFIWVLIVIFGFLGTLANSLIIIILKKHRCAKAFEILLCFLASFDLICSAMTICSSTGIIAYLRNWDRGSGILKWIDITYFTTVLGRTGSTFIKVLIAAERYFFIAYPEESGMWLSKTKTRVSAVIVLGFSVILNIPRFMSHSVSRIDDRCPNVTKLYYLGAQYGLEDTMKGSWLENWKEISIQIDSWAPFPLLIFFTAMIHWEIKKITSEKQALQVTRKKDIREVQMFVPVIIVLFICNILPVVHFMVMKHTQTIYREQVLAMLLFVAVSSAVNLPIYIGRGSTFRKEARAVLYKITNRVG